MQIGIARSTNLDHQEMHDAFLSHMDRLLLPAYLLTGSHEQASDCFLDALNSCSDQSPPRSGYAVRVAQRAIIKAAIGRIAPKLKEIATNTAGSSFAVAANERHALQPELSGETFLQAILALNVFHRAVLVLRLYEGYSAADASLLLGVSRRTLEFGWQRALIALVEATVTSTAEEQASLPFDAQYPLSGGVLCDAP